MTVLEELRHALVLGPAAPARLRRRGWAFLALYLALAGAILGVVGWLAGTYRQDAVRPRSRARPRCASAPEETRLGVPRALPGAGRRHPRRRRLARRHLPQGRRAPGGGPPLPRLPDRPPDEFPLWHQAWEEIILFLLFLAAQGSIFWLGWTAEPWRRTAAIVASFTFPFASFGIGFLSPLLQR